MSTTKDEQLKRTFASEFGRRAAVQVSVPGRVNLIGEHIDYTGGTVLPTPIPGRLRLLFTAGGTTVTVRSQRFAEPVERELEEAIDGHWSDYLLAGHRKAIAVGLLPPGTGGEYLIDSEIPDGAGVSSSAALLVALLRAAAETTARTTPPEQLARWAQEVETQDIGMPCGIMDQMAVAAGEPGFAMALNTRTLAYRQVPLPTGYAFPVLHSGLKRQLADGAYKARRDACAEAAEALGLASIEDLSTVDDDGLARAAALPDPIARRARHAITEHRRVLRAIETLANGDVQSFGALMNESHRSMRDDFEIVPKAMDEMTEHACRSGAFGSRLTGGGFGGCFVSCVPSERLGAWLVAMRTAFPDTWVVTEGLIAPEEH
ncbi:galactokinase [Parvularcula dongshanensis]|uniref:Galactokinase n=1 Tax=Parvularcula dongshanensis TaxID=1173995 RepID=A0A840I8C2_9PROT|nr:galactokinase [Parvularcula dongshanensis]MBB4660404.1 galactokinase [Parvularcula dongshanensis]